VGVIDDEDKAENGNENGKNGVFHALGSPG
jgi:hypothetical protein